MPQINRKFFFDEVRARLFDGRFRQSQVDGLTSLLSYWEENHADKDDRWLADGLDPGPAAGPRGLLPVLRLPGSGQRLTGLGQIGIGRPRKGLVDRG